MNTNKFLFLVLFASSVILFSSCKEKIQREYYFPNVATRIESSAKTSPEYEFTIYCGHERSQCKGACITVNGVPAHLPCMGYGNLCNAVFSVRTEIVSNNNYNATTLDSTALTNEDFFNMPSRSLFVEYDEKNNEVWLNIPAQLVYRDSTTLQFTFTGLYYTESPEYTND